MSGIIRKKQTGEAWETVEDTGGGGSSQAVPSFYARLIWNLANGSPHQVVSYIQSAFFAQTDPTSVEDGGFSASVTTPPTPVSAGGTVAEVAFGEVVNFIPNNDPFDLVATLIVTNPGATEIIIVTATGQIPALGTEGAVDWTTATVDAFTGTDLVWDGASPTKTVKSTAGDTFISFLQFFGTYD